MSLVNRQSSITEPWQRAHRGLGVTVNHHQFDLGRLAPDLIIHIVVVMLMARCAFGDDLATIRDVVRPQARQMLASSAPIDEQVEY